MHKISAFLLSLSLLCLTGCEDKKSDEDFIDIDTSTNPISQVQDYTGCKNKFTIDNNKSTADVPFTPIEVPKLIEGSNTFMLINTKSKSHKVTLSPKEIIFHRNTKDIVLINLFATWCTPCVGELSYFNILQKKYNDTLLLIGVLSHDTIDMTSLKSFVAKHAINYFISSSPHNNAFSSRIANTLQLPKNYSIPLTVMYVKGKYFTHYEGIVPIEMIEYDIQQAKKQLKSNKE